jgi:hypothetical protein
VTGLAVLALHRGVLWLLQAAAERHHGPHPAADETPRVSVRLLVPPPAIAIAQPSPRIEPATSTAVRVPGHRQLRNDLATNPSITQSSNPDGRQAARPSNPAKPAATAAAPAASAANALVGLPLLFDTEATRRAIRESARAPSLAGHAAAASVEPARTSAQERLGNDVKSAGKGDCLMVPPGRRNTSSAPEGLEKTSGGRAFPHPASTQPQAWAS